MDITYFTQIYSTVC